MTSAAISPAASTRMVRADERTLLVSAGGVFALANAGAAMSGAAADAMFLAEIGPGSLGLAMALSSALLAIVLAVVGGLADRLERRRILATLALVSAIVLGGLAALAMVAPGVAAVATFVGGKQLAAATDLAFWVVIAERLDARRSRRVLPMLAATGGAGAAAGGLLVNLAVGVIGTGGILLAAAAMLALAGAGAARLAATRRVKAPVAPMGALIARSWRDGARAVRRNPLARQLAILVFVAGAFASFAYFALAVEIAADRSSSGQTSAARTAEFAALLGAVRAAAQILTLAVQVVVAPKLLERLGTGQALLLAPLVALAAGLGLVIAPILAIAIATQVSSRVLDASVETPGEKLAQTLLPTAIRGRVGGFLDGTAKRAGAVLGGLVAAALVTTPTAFYVITALTAAVWLAVALRIAKELPALAVEHAGGSAAELDAVDARAIEVLRRELSGPRPERAAEVLTRLHERGRVNAVDPLVRAVGENHGAPLWRALIAVLDTPAEVHGPALVAAARAVHGADLELAVRAIGLCGGASAEDLAAYRAADDAALALTAQVAIHRLANDVDATFALLAEAIRDTGPTGRAATDELCVEIARARAAQGGATGRPEDPAAHPALASLYGARRFAAPATSSPAPDSAPTAGGDRMFEAARHLTRALRRGRGETASRAAAFGALTRVVAWARERRSAELALLRADLLELARDRVEAGASKVAPDHMLTSLMRVPHQASGADDAVETAAALRLIGALLEGADAVDPDDLRRVARALGEPDDDVRAAAEDALTALGPAAAGELMVTAAWGRRRARDRAAALLAELPVTPAALDRLIDAELDALERTHTSIAVLTSPGDELLARRLEERLREIAHTVLLLVAARRRSPSITAAAAAWGHARGGLERARTLAVVEAALPRSLVARLVDAVDDVTPSDRAAALEKAGVELPARDAVVRAELAGRDRLARALALHVIGAAGRSAHRDTIAQAAEAEALAANPSDLMRRLSAAIGRDPKKPVPPDAAVAPSVRTEGEEGADMPSRVETLIALGRVPLLATLTTRQLADVAERARWVTTREGGVIITAGDVIDALIVVDDGELALGDRRIVKGEVVDELACVAPLPVPHDLRATRAARVIRLERIDFEELVDDVPGLAAAVCRALGERARRADDRAYRSPLLSRA